MPRGPRERGERCCDGRPINKNSYSLTSYRVRRRILLNRKLFILKFDFFNCAVTVRSSLVHMQLLLHTYRNTLTPLTLNTHMLPLHACSVLRPLHAVLNPARDELDLH